MLNLDSIPHEMRLLNQWVVWKHENRGDDKLTKVPYSPKTQRLASINNPNDWGSFNDVKSAVKSKKFAGIGFILTLSDPFCFVDLDSPGSDEDARRQIEIAKQLDSFSEISPSGNGLHIICKASVPAGRRRMGVEIYSSARFMTMTGNVYNNVEIKFKQQQITELWESLEGVGANAEFATHSVESNASDLEVYNEAANASNGAKFLALWNGDIESYHGGDHSRADMALVDIIAFYTQDREQISRLFLSSGLGQRQKAKREDYRQNMITKSFDKLIPPVDISAVMLKVDSFIHNNKPELESTAFAHDSLVPRSVKSQLQPVVKSEELQATEQTKIDEVFQMPPGLTGDIANFIYQQAWKPVPQIATMGALGLMAGLAGRAYNASGSGLNLYLLLLAKTGRGKEAISKAYEKLFDAITPLMPQIGDFSGPADLASGQALLRYMSDHQTKSFVSVFGEFGPMLKRITSPTAIGADLMTQKVMLDMYSKSGKSGKISPTAYSDAERNTKTIHSPGFSFIAESAPKWFDENVDLGMIATGLLPRFIIAEYDGKRVESNEAGPLMVPDNKLIQDICALATCSMTCFQQNIVYDIPFCEETKILSRKLDKLCDLRINEADDEIVAELWNRVHLNTIRIAALIAVGNNPYGPLIDVECWQWAERFIIHNIGKLEEKFAEGGLSMVVDSSVEFAETEKLEKTIMQYILTPHEKLKSYSVSESMHRCRVVPYVYFNRRLTRLRPFKDSKIGATNAIKRAIQNLIDNGDLQEIDKRQAKKDFDFTGRCFVLSSTRILEQAKQAETISDS